MQPTRSSPRTRAHMHGQQAEHNIRAQGQRCTARDAPEVGPPLQDDHDVDARDHQSRRHLQGSGQEGDHGHHQQLVRHVDLGAGPKHEHEQESKTSASRSEATSEHEAEDGNRQTCWQAGKARTRASPVRTSRSNERRSRTGSPAATRHREQEITGFSATSSVGSSAQRRQD